MADDNSVMVYRCTVCWTVQEGFVEQQKMAEVGDVADCSTIGHCSLCGVVDALFKRVQREAAHERNVVQLDLQETI